MGMEFNFLEVIILFFLVTALDKAKQKLLDDIKPVVNDTFVPIVNTFLILFLIFAITKAAISYKRSNEFDLAPILIIIVSIILVTTFNTWGWQLIPD
jgi:hypothetical protein